MAKSPAKPKKEKEPKARNASVRRGKKETIPPAGIDYGAIFEAAIDAILLYDPKQGKILAVNRKMCDLFGYTAEEACQMDLAALFLPKEPSTLDDLLVLSKKALAGAVQCFERQAQNRTGRPFWVEAYLQKAPGTGRRRRVLAFLRDITERRRVEDNLKSALVGGQDRLVNLVNRIAEILSTEEALKESESRYRMVTEESLAGVYIIQDRKFLYVNPRFAQIFGYGAEEIMEAPIVPGDLVHPDDLPLVREIIRRRLAGEADTAHYTFRGRHKDGTTIHCESLGRRVEYRGHPAIVGTLLDITARREAEEALRQSEKRYRAIVEDQTELICRFQADGPLTFVNEAYCRYFGKDREQLIGHTFMPLIPEADREGVAATIVRLTPENPLVTHEHRVVKPDGDFAWHQWTNRAIYDEQGRLIEFQAVGRDVTARRLAEEALRAQQNLLNTIFSVTPDMLILVNRDLAARAVNPAACHFLGKPAEEIVGKTAFDLFPREEAERYLRDDLLALETGLTLVTDEEATGATGKRWLQFIRTPILGDQGQSDGLLFSIRDITDRKRMEGELRRREAILEAVGFAAMQLLQVSAWEENLQEILARLGEAAAVSRVYIYEKHLGRDGEPVVSQRYEWTAPGVSTQMDRPWSQDFDYREGGYGGWEDMLLRAEGVHGHVKDFPPDIQKRLQRQEIISLVIVPIMVAAEPWGFMGFDECRGERDWFTAEIEALRAAANLLGAAIQRRQAEETLREAEEKLRAIISASPLAILSLDQDGLVKMWNQAAERIFGWTEAEVLDRPIPIVPWDKLEESVLLRRRQLQGECLTGAELKRRTRDGSLIDVSLSAAPLQDRQGRVYGLVGFLADITARKEVEKALLESEQKLRLLTSQLLSAQEQERRRVSRELHDELGQALTVLKIHLVGLENRLRKDQLRLKEHCAYLLSQIDEIIENLRRLAWDLSPSILEDLGLSSSLKYLVEEICRSYNMISSMEMDEIDHLFPPEVQINIYRLFQESLSNAGKHAQASRLGVVIKRLNQHVSFLIEDNGLGFDPEKIMSRNIAEKRLGLTTMHERARMAGGALRLFSQPGRGTRIAFDLPIYQKGP